MLDYTILEIPTVLDSPFQLKDIFYNCPVCDYEIEINILVDDNSFIICEVCEHLIKLKIKKI